MDTQKSITLLNDLIVINNDRVEGYKTAEIETPETDLKILFYDMQATSESNRIELASAVTKLNGEVEEGTRATGKFFRFWMDFKATITGNNRGTILDSCEYGEDKALEEYENVLDEKEHLSIENLQMIQRQKAQIEVDHTKVKKLRDEAMD